MTYLITWITVYFASKQYDRKFTLIKFDAIFQINIWLQIIFLKLSVLF